MPNFTHLGQTFGLAFVFVLVLVLTPMMMTTGIEWSCNGCDDDDIMAILGVTRQASYKIMVTMTSMNIKHTMIKESHGSESRFGFRHRPGTAKRSGAGSGNYESEIKDGRSATGKWEIKLPPLPFAPFRRLGPGPCAERLNNPDGIPGGIISHRIICSGIRWVAEPNLLY